MEYLWIMFVLTLLIIINTAAINAVWQESILYSKNERILKMVFILMIPFLGAIVELYMLSKDYKKSENYRFDEVKWYAFFESSHINDEVSASVGESSPKEF